MLWADLLQYGDLGQFLLRLAVGVVFVYHAIPKLKNPKGMAAGMGMANMAWFPAVLGLVELVSALGIVFGVYLQLAALLLAIVMLGAAFMKMGKWKMPFSAMDKTGWEFDMVLFAAAVSLLLGGGGDTLVLFS